MPKDAQDPCKTLTGTLKKECVEMRAMFTNKALVQGPLCWLSLKLPPKRLEVALNQLTGHAMSLKKADRLFMAKEAKREENRKGNTGALETRSKSGMRSASKAGRK